MVAHFCKQRRLAVGVEEELGKVLTLEVVACQLQILEYQNCAVHGGVEATLGIGAKTKRNRSAIRREV
jgi:hypothetical protein